LKILITGRKSPIPHPQHHKKETTVTRNFDDLLRGDALTFAKHAHSELHQSDLSDDPYLRLLAYDVEQIVSRTIKRYVCNLPPGHGKTFVISVVLTALLLGHNPSGRILIVCYGEDLAKVICKKILKITRTTWYRKAFPRTILAKNHQTDRDFSTTAGGSVYARSIDGAITGLRCDDVIVDDAVQICDSGNIPHLESVNAKFDTEVVSRLNNPLTGTIVVVQHRLNQSDLTGHVLKRGDWTHRVLPLIATEDCQYPMKEGVWCRKKGNVLRPDAFSAKTVAELREQTGAPGFDPLYQQRFDGPDVVQVRRQDFVLEQFFMRPFGLYILSVDPNHRGELGASYSVVQCWVMLAGGKGFLLYDQWRGRASKRLLATTIRQLCNEHRPQVILIEDNGPALELNEKFDSPTCPVILLQPRGDKAKRLRPHLDLFRNRKVVLRAGAPYLNDFIAEFEAFPYGPHSDQVDAATQFFNWIRSNDLPLIARPQRATGAVGSARLARAKLYSGFSSNRPLTPNVFCRRRRGSM
jgi:predicted phage terminase large subunit-like protein